MTTGTLGNVVSFRLCTRYTPAQIASLFFTSHDDVTLPPPSFLRRAYEQIAHNIDISPDTDSLSATRQTLVHRGFDDAQIGTFLRVVQTEVARFLTRYAQNLHGPEAEANSLDLYYSPDFFLGVRLGGERLDHSPEYGFQLHHNIYHALRESREHSPQLFRIGSPTLLQRAANRRMASPQP